MKRIYQRLKMSALSLESGRKFFFAVVLLSGSFTAFAQELVFKNPTLESGVAAQNNAVYRFPNVTTAVDALVKVKGRSSSSVVINNIDVTETGWNKAFQPQIGMNGTVTGIKDWWVDFEISFVKTGTSQSADVSEFSMTSLDVDGDGLTIREYVEINGASSYAFETGTELVFGRLDDDPLDPKGKNYRCTGPIKNYLDIDTSGTRVMVTSRFEKKNKFKLRIGALAVGLGNTTAGLRYNSIWFRSFNYVVVTTLPVKLTSFTLKSLEDKKVMLNWATAQEKNSSHFTVEKSMDGKEFSDAGLVFSMGTTDLPQQYSFTDDLRAGQKGIIYYRLKMVDVDGNIQHSPIKTIRIGDEKQNISLLIYPNPVASELRVTLPAAWIDQKVVIDVYSANGVLAKRFTTNNASQTETIDVRSLAPGSYMVKTSAGADSATQQIIKR